MDTDDTELSYNVPSVVGFLFVFLFLAIIAFYFTHDNWYDTWKTGEQIDFWVAVGTLALAIATVALAFVTLRTLQQARDANTLAERHHQEALAPLVIVRELRVVAQHEGHNVDMGTNWAQRIAVSGQLLNIGSGVAVDVRASLVFEGCKQEEIVKLANAVPPDPKFPYPLDGERFFILLPAGQKEFIRAGDSEFDMHSWQLVIEYSSVFGGKRVTEYEHALSDSFETTEKIGPLNVVSRPTVRGSEL